MLIDDNDKNSKICPVCKFNISYFSKWEKYKISENYFITFRLIGKNIIWSIPYGFSENDNIKNYIEARKNFINEINLTGKKIIEVKDFANISNKIIPESRKDYTRFLLEELNTGNLIAYFGYNAPFFIKTMFNIGYLLYDLDCPVKIVSGYKAAIKNAVEVLKGKPKTLSNKKNKNLYSQDKIEKYLKQLTFFIDAINWETEGVAFLQDKIIDDHPFKKIYESLYLIKYDFDNILKENKKKSAELLNAYNQMEMKVIERTKELNIKNKMLLKTDNELIEKNSIVETSLDILSHDTKNIFTNLYTLIEQEEKTPINSLIKENIDELFDMIMETTGIMKSKRRIFYLVDMLNKIQVTKDRIYLKDHKRFLIKYDSTYNLFIETPALFKNAITNIIENAIKYSPQDKKIVISLKYKYSNIFIHIIDRGKGIPDCEKQKIFQKYYRMKGTENIEGTGRGLWITKNILKMSNAKIKVSDNPAGGSIFTIKIPSYKVKNLDEDLKLFTEWFNIPIKKIKEKADTIKTFLLMHENSNIEDIDTAVFTSLLLQLRVANKKKKESYINNKINNLLNKNPEGKKVIIVDDSIYVHLYLASYFTEMGYNVLGFGRNGEEAILLYEKYKPDIITLDNTMPGMPGTEAANTLFRLDNSIKILFITAVGETGIFLENVKNFPDKNYKILVKPINKEHLESAVEELLKN